MDGIHFASGRLALAPNVRLGYKRLTVTNTPAYYDTEFITAIKSYTLQAQGPKSRAFYSHHLQL
jgi:hypothetical protein